MTEEPILSRDEVDALLQSIRPAEGVQPRELVEGKVDLVVRLSAATLARDVLALPPGSTLVLDAGAEGECWIEWEGKPIARGKGVRVGDRWEVTLTSVILP